MDIRKWYDRYSTDCRLKYPSKKTQENYSCSVGTFLNYFKNEIEPKSISVDKIKEWLLTFDTINTRNHKLCAIKSFYLITVGMPLKLDKIPYSKKDKKLPIILSVDEIQRMFDVCENKKHKVILALLYSCSLRVSELLNLKWQDIDRSRMIINIIQGKGNKDRQVGLNDKLIELLADYYKEYKPIIYVLNGQNDAAQYSERSVGQVIKQLAQKANIDNKRVYTHLMRHTSATHMVESGTDINLIQKLLGHQSVKTTNIYLHISHNHISKIQSPLQQINL
jgi:integrase/recombinase XerD